jgi:hypothetical protein
VLALTRTWRARGDYIGRIDQTPLVGERFLRWFSEATDVRRNGALFANRRVPFRFTARSPSLRQAQVCPVVRALPVSRNDATNHLFWTSFVGIWLAHRRLWHECGVRRTADYYNWMERT